ncbi:MAG: hypothetical protein E7350_04425 [Clostridiales bacterium]|nr:hypothetical protein [Clostridiales bacterium]
MNNKELCNTLIYIGITPDRKGFSYLVQAALLVKSTMMLKDVFRQVSINFNTNQHTIDSSIRNAIQSAFHSRKLLRLNEKLGMEIIDKDNCPTTKAIIYYLAHYLNTLAPENDLSYGKSLQGNLLMQ